MLIAARGQTFNRWVVSSPEFEELVLAHSQRFPTNERTRRLLAADHAGFLTDADVLTEAEIDAEPVFRDFLIPRGYGSGVATAIYSPSGDTFILHADRPRKQGPIPRDVVARLDSLRPHFARAALLSARLEMERVNATTTALELIGLPAAVVGASGCLIAANTPLARLMPSVVQDRQARVVLTDSCADSLLAAALAARRAGPDDAAVCSIPIRARDEYPPFVVHLVPITRAAPRRVREGNHHSRRHAGRTERGSDRNSGSGPIRSHTGRGKARCARGCR